MPALSDERSLYPIRRAQSSLGSGAQDTIRLEGEGVLPGHALISYEGGRLEIRPLAEKATLCVNGRRRRRHRLEDQDLITIGSRSLTFEFWKSKDEDLKADASPATPQADEDQELSAYRRFADFTARIGGEQQLDTLFETLLDEVISLTGAERGFLISFDQDERPALRCARHIDPETLALSDARVGFSDSVLQRVQRERRALVINDALSDAEFRESESVMQLQLSSVMCAPLLFREQLLGIVYVANHRPAHRFPPRTLSILELFASQAALLLASALQRSALDHANQRLKVELQDLRFGEIVGRSEAMRQVYDRIERVAPTSVNVLISGETGTGKELIARELHRRSDRSEGPFVALNCAALPAGLMESELFGHRRGAFTGAVKDQPGAFRAASGGTLFLDEVGEMSPQLQVKLLRVLQEREVLPIGATTPEPIDLRLITATHVDLEAAVQRRQFREDLYYRVNVFQISLPPLRERGDDIVLIARYLVEQLARRYESPTPTFTFDALLALRKYSWPGNIRELENRISQALIMSEGATLSGESLGLGEEVIAGELLPLAVARRKFQERYIEHVLALNQGNRTKTAQDLGVDPRTIFRHLEQRRALQSKDFSPLPKPIL